MSDPLDKILEDVGLATEKQKSEEQTISEVLNNAEKLEPPEYPDKLKRRTLIICLAVLGLIVIQFTRVFIIQTHQVAGNSMEPTLHEGDRLIVSKLSKKFNSVRGADFVPKRDTLIALRDPQDEKLELVKRIVGLPGERVVIKSGKVTIYNQNKPDGFEPGLGGYGDKLSDTSGDVDVTIEEGKVFVLGDNRSGAYSLDSRSFGTVSNDLIIGTVELRIWPFGKRTKF